jgi:integrase
MRNKYGPKGPAKPLTGGDIARVEVVVRNSPRDYALFTIGTQTAFRGGDILSLNCSDVRGKSELHIREKKTGKVRITPLNGKVRVAIGVLCAERADDEPLFVGSKRGTRLTICTLSRLWRRWCEEAGVGHRGGSHVGRKTWARRNYEKGARIEVIGRALNHGSPATTFAYIMISDAELNSLYEA